MQMPENGLPDLLVRRTRWLRFRLSRQLPPFRVRAGTPPVFQVVPRSSVLDTFAATSTRRMAFTSWASFNLEEGALYWLNDVVKEQPYRDQQRVKLDEHTSGNLRPRSPVDHRNSGRELRPRPPPSHQPRFLEH